MTNDTDDTHTDDSTDDPFEMAGGWELPDGYDDPREMTPERLMDELQTMAAHANSDLLTDEQDHYYEALRVESLRRMSTGGEYADYTGPGNGGDADA